MNWLYWISTASNRLLQTACCLPNTAFVIHTSKPLPEVLLLSKVLLLLLLPRPLSPST